MSKSINNYIDYLSKEKIIRNYPQTPCIKNKNNKEDRIPFNNSKSRTGSISKNKNGDKNSSKKYKKYQQDNHISNNYMNKNFCPKYILNINNVCNNGFIHKNSNSFGNIKEFNYYLNNNMLNNNISSNNFYSKKINNILNSDNFNKSNNIKNNTDSNHINKMHSLIHNNGVINNNCSYNVNTNNDRKNSSKKKNINNNKRPSAPINKNNDDKKSQNIGKPISLLENKNQKIKNNNTNNIIKPIKNIQINKTQFNNYNIYNSNHFLKRNILSNITYTNELYYNNNLILSQKNDSIPVSMKYQIPNKSNKKQKNIKKSQSQSHFNYRISRDLNTKNKNKNSKSKSKSKSKNKSKINNNIKATSSYKGKKPQKHMIKNKTTNLNKNKIYDINNNLLNYSNLIKNSSQKKNHFINVIYPIEESKTMPYYSEIYNSNYKNNNYIYNNLPRNFGKDLNDIKKLWEEIGGVTLEYQEKFINYVEEYENKNVIFSNEINELVSIINNLNKLNNDILKRDEIINNIKKINDNNLENNNFNEIKSLLISLRIITIDVINDYILFLKEISYDTLMNKFDLSKIKNFDKNYLNKMKSDTNFLTENNHLNKIFSFSKNTPFFLDFQKSNNQLNNKLLSSIENDIFKKVSICEYFLFKEKIYNKITSIKNNNILKNQSLNPETNNNIENNDIKNIKNDKNISYFNISNNKSEYKYNRYKYSYYKCNEFSYINKSNNKENSKINNENNKENNNFISEEINHIIINQNNNLIDNVSKIVKNADSDIEKESEVISNLNDFIESPIEKKNHKSNAFNDNLQIEPYDIRKDSSLSLLYKNYLSSVSENIKLSFNINTDIYYYSTIGIFPKILLFKDNYSNIKGICTLSFNENLNIARKILTITSISCSRRYKISKLLLKLIDFCKNKEISFDSIEINLYYIKNEEGKFILDNELEKEIKSEAKFKWIRLENDGEKRKIKYHYLSNNIITNKENSIINNNFLDLNCNNRSSINLNNYVLIKYYQENGINNISMIEHCHLFFIIKLLKNYFLLGDNEEKEIHNILENFKGIKLKKIIRILSEYNDILETNSNDFKKDYCSNDNYNMELLYTFLEIIEKNKNQNEKESILFLNFNNIFTNFNNIIKIEIDNYEYNIISMKDYIIEVFKINDDTNNNDEFDEGNINNFNIYENNDNNINIYQNNPNESQKEKELLYFTKSENENISFIFYEIKENNNNIINDNYVKFLFNKVLKKILVKDSQEPIKSYKKICIPSFSYKKRNTDNNPNDKLKLIECDILDCNETFDFCIEKLSFNDIKFSFPLNNNVEDNDEIKIIKNNFVVAVINNDLILDYHLPSMNIFYINKDAWIKIKK